jgi:hypothetical protein
LPYIVQVQGQASVGGLKIDGTGEKITDFLFKNSLTNNVGIFEIKRPATALVSKKSYRTGVFGPSKELAGSITQVLDQRYQLQKSLLAKKDSSRDYSLEQYSLRCCLIVGTVPDGDDEKKSFELIRNELKDVDVVTYDELFEKLVQLRDFMRGARTVGASSEEATVDSVPSDSGDSASVQDEPPAG